MNDEAIGDGLTLAPFKSADYDEAVALWRATDGVGLNECDEREPVAAYLDRNPGLSLVLREQGRLVGAVLCGHDGRRGYLNHLAIVPECRGRGLGRLMVERCCARLAEAGILKCNIFLYVDNDEGERFWKALGFGHRSDLQVLQRPTAGR
jgi:ribosomal protein S18 acetylase RimI-like enzyme